MTLRSLAPRFALVLVAAAVASCDATTDFVVERTVQVASPGGAFGPVTEQVDLSTVGQAWSSRSHVKELSIVSAEATIVSIDAGAATTGSATLAVRPDGGTAADDVVVGSFTDQPIAPGRAYALAVSPAANAVLMDALQGTGRFSVVASGATAAPVTFTLDATIQVHVRYSPF